MDNEAGQCPETETYFSERGAPNAMQSTPRRCNALVWKRR